MKNSEKAKVCFAVLITRALPLFFTVCSVIRVMELSGLDHSSIFPLESLSHLCTMLMFFATLALSDLFPTLFMILLILFAAMPGLISVCGGFLPPQRRLRKAMICMLPFVLDIAASLFMENPITALMDVGMLVLLFTALTVTDPPPTTIPSINEKEVSL